MFTKGEFSIDNVTYGAILNHTKAHTEAILVTSGTVVSAYKTDETGSYSYNNNKAKELVRIVLAGVKGCTSKNSVPAPFELGAMTQHEFTKTKVEYLMQIYRGEVVGAYIQSDKARVEMQYINTATIPNNIPYVKLTEVKKDLDLVEDDLDAVQVRSVQEIALEKDDISWLENKKYYIVNDDETAENLFKFLDNYSGVIAYDTETTGLRINCFGKINSNYAKTLKKYNEEHPDEQVRADKLVGIIFCVENDTSYYFPCFNRKFKNLYQDLDSKVRINTINNIKARYTVGDLKNSDGDMADYVRNTPSEQFSCDVILMERCRDILHTKHLVAHNGTFEWKVGWQYEIDTNICDDTMIMHQLMYKFRSTTKNAGEPSNLKYLAKRELGVDQWELSDFFPDWKADGIGTVRTKADSKKKKNGSKIDFSYMDLEGTRVYAPTDGDVTFQLFNMYKKDMVQNHKEMEYIYSVEIIVSSAIAYMEFYGHRLDESKILNAREQTKADLIMIESEIRQKIEYSSKEELDAYNELKSLRKRIEELDKKTDEQSKKELKQLEEKMPTLCEKIKKAIDENTTKVINLSSPAQVADLFYNKLGYPMQGDKMSVDKKSYKALMKEKNEDGTDKCPVAFLYASYKDKETQLSKFYDSLPYFMYPGGFIFSSYGQISTATGRMSCIEENTLITVAGGRKPIKDIEIGDLVYCYDENGQLHLRKVLNVIDKGMQECISTTFEELNTKNKNSLISTPDHKVLVDNNMWLRADKLSYSDKICGMSKVNNNVAYYNAVSNINIGIKHVYDLEIEEFHNFIANEICVHNCSKPNAQQYPKLITKIVIPRDGYIMCDADYSQIEYRVLTALAGNEWLAELFSNPDSDYHTLMASLMYEVDYSAVTSSMRSAAKSFNFGIPYGMGLGSLAILLTGKNTPQTRDEAAERMEAYFKNQPRTKKFFDNVKEMAQVNGYTKTLFNRYRYYTFVDKDGNVNNGKKAAALRQAGNAVIQGCLGGETRIETKELGIVAIKDAVGYSGEVWNGTRWTHGDVLYSGKKQKCIITFTNGQKFICSPIHRFLRQWHDASDESNYIQCKDLMHGDRIAINRCSELQVNIPDDILKSFDKFIAHLDVDADETCISTPLDMIDFQVESVEITDEYIDMYDVCNTDDGYYVADGIITHNTAADIFKIGVARNFSYIRRNGLLGKLLIVNMIHDEQLMEIDVQHLNAQRILADVGKNMQFKIDGFPPLYIGAGIGKAWGYAKGKMAEIHPNLLADFTKEAENIPIFREDCSTPVDTHEVLDYFDKRVYEFRRNKVATYLSDPENFGKDIHPAIGSLINLQFNYDRGDSAKGYTGPNGEKYTDAEFLALNIADFIEENHINAKAEYFKANDTMAQQKAEDEEKEDKQYVDGEEDEDVEDMLVEGDEGIQSFSKVDESDKLFGSSIQDLINIFGACIIEQSKVIGVNVKDMHFRKRDALVDYLTRYVCDEDDPDGLQIVFLKAGNILNYTGVYVKGIKSSDFDKTYKTLMETGKLESDMDFTEGDVQNRSQAK
jgi:DNA polymerase I-like protein with 3'-5' exonuclease and polymerase domains